MRRVRVLLAGAAVLALLVPSPAAAGSLVRESDTRTTLFCDGLSSGSTELFLFSETSDAFGSFTDISIWSGGGSGPPSIVSDGGAFTLAPSGGSGTVSLAEFDDSEPDSTGDAAGTATLSATFTPSGPAESYEFTERDGNRTFRIEGVFQPLAVTGTLSVDFVRGRDASFGLGTCFAGTDTYSFSATDPASYVSGDRRIDLFCQWETDRGFVSLFAMSDRWGTFSELFIADGRKSYFGFSQPLLTSSAFAADYTIVDDGSGTFVGSASASATLTQTDERIDFRDRSGNIKYDESGWMLAVDGSLTMTIGRTTTTLPMDTTTCQASDVRVKIIATKPTGPKLKNDAPSGAVALSIPSSIEVKTGGTAEAPEAACTVSSDGETFDIPITHTAWWTFTGTGGDVTIDTAASNFDTVVGVYVLNGGAFQQVGCVDDVFDPETGEGSLQSRITVATTAGQTYYVQAGGFGGSAGTLRLSIE